MLLTKPLCYNRLSTALRRWPNERRLQPPGSLSQFTTCFTGTLCQFTTCFTGTKWPNERRLQPPGSLSQFTTCFCTSFVPVKQVNCVPPMSTSGFPLSVYYLLYRCKIINTDAEGAAQVLFKCFVCVCAGARLLAHALSLLLALLVRKDKY
jgi:hypothetical protein